MSDAALDYVQNLIKSGQKIDQIKADLLKKGWEKEVIDLYISKASSDNIPSSKPKNNLIIILPIIFLLILGLLVAYYFLIYSKTSNQLINQPPTYTASPSAELATESDTLRQLKSGYALLFAPPEYGYEATISAQIENCSATIFYQSRSLPKERYDLKTIKSSQSSCQGFDLSNQHIETFRYSTEGLTRNTPLGKFTSTTDLNSLPPISDEQIKSYISSPENFTILSTENTDSGLVVKTTLKTSDLEGNYNFTLRPINFRISKIQFSAAQTKNNQIYNINGEMTFMNRARITTPNPSQINK